MARYQSVGLTHHGRMRLGVEQSPARGLTVVYFKEVENERETE